MKFKGTSNKLRVTDVHNDTATFDVKDSNSRIIATFWRYNQGQEVISFEEQKANAVIFSRAHELLDILQILLNEDRVKEASILSGELSTLNDNIKKAKDIINQIVNK